LFCDRAYKESLRSGSHAVRALWAHAAHTFALTAPARVLVSGAKVGRPFQSALSLSGGSVVAATRREAHEWKVPWRHSLRAPERRSGNRD